VPTCGGRSCASLAAITLGAIGYIATDDAFRVEAYMWIVAWFIMFAIDVVYIKYIIDTGAHHRSQASRPVPHPPVRPLTPAG
jgi:hypothetical protein